MIQPPTITELRRAVELLENLPDLVIEATYDRDLTPADVAKQSGVAITTLMKFADEPPKFTTPVALLRWLAEGER